MILKLWSKVGISLIKTDNQLNKHLQVMMVMGKRQIKLELEEDGNWCLFNVQIEECNEVRHTVYNVH